MENKLQTINMPPKNSRRPAKKLSEFKKLQLERNPSQAREIWIPVAPFEEKNVKEFLATLKKKDDWAKGIFKEEPDENGQKSLAPLDEFGNTFLHMAALEDNPKLQ